MGKNPGSSARGRLRGIGGVVAVLLLSGCWEQVGYGGGHSYANPAEDQLTTANVASLHEDWSVPFPGASVHDEPIVSDGRVYVSAVANVVGGPSAVDVHAFDAATGAPAWSTNILSQADADEVVATNPAIAAGSLWTGATAVFQVAHFTQCGSLAKRLDPATGSVVAESGATGSSAVQSGSSVVHLTGDLRKSSPCAPTSSLVVRDADTLAVRWSAPLGSVGVVPDGVGPTVSGDRVIFADQFAVRAYPLDGCGAATCSPVWMLPVPDGAFVLGQPAAGAGDQLFVAIGHAFDVPGGSTELVALSRTTGAVRWTAPIDDNFRFEGRLAVSGGRVHVAGGQVFAAAGCGAATCSPLFTMPPPGGVDPAAATAGPVVAGGVVYEGGPGYVLGYDAAGCGTATCAPLVTVPVTATPSGLSVSDGRLYVTGGQSLTAYAP